MRYFDDCMTLEELKARYKQWVLKLHPDRNPDNPNAEADFKDMQEQYECREAELKGDYSKTRRSRQRQQEREREARERAEKERKEREQRKVEAAIEQARKNKNRSHTEWKVGEYIYARKLNPTTAYEWENLMADELMHMVCKEGVQDEIVVMIETIVELADGDFFKVYLNSKIPEGVWGGYEVLQDADRSAGRLKGKRVAKLVMFRSPKYCIYGNPMGDQTIRDYYMPIGYETIFSTQLDKIRAKIEHEKQERERIESERKAKLLEEQKPLLLEWQDKLIELSKGLSLDEQHTVTRDNIRCMLAHSYMGTRFSVKGYTLNNSELEITWEDGPTVDEVLKKLDPFFLSRQDADSHSVTPWAERYGAVLYKSMRRKMSVLTKARILQQLGQVTMVFRNAGYYDEVEVTGFDMQMLEALAGVQFGDVNAKHCQSQYRNNMYYVRVENAVRFIFNNTSYYKPRRKTSKTKSV